MTLEELKIKAKTGQIKLEDLEIEDILKFLNSGFINCELAEYFNLSKEQVKAIRKKKNLLNADYEDCLRNLIVLFDYIKRKYPTFADSNMRTIAIDIIAGLGISRGKETYYISKANSIDWENLNIENEIKNRKIDIEYRIDRVQTLIELLESYIQKYPEFVYDYPNINPIYKEEYSLEKQPRKELKNKSIQTYPRNSSVANRALENAGYLCELNPAHPTFIRRSNGKRYMEIHHLIPLEYQKYFVNNLDVEANIVCLCSNCHNEIHYGVNYKKLLNILYNERKDRLRKCGIVLNSVEDLYRMYESSYEGELVY